MGAAGPQFVGTIPAHTTQILRRLATAVVGLFWPTALLFRCSHVPYGCCLNLLFFLPWLTRDCMSSKPSDNDSRIVSMEAMSNVVCWLANSSSSTFNTLARSLQLSSIAPTPPTG